MITIGSDPEFMVISPEGKLTSAITILPNYTKKDKCLLPSGGCVFYDNVQLEINVVPAESAEKLIDNLRDTFKDVKNLIHPYKFIPRASATFDPSELNHKDSSVFGCDPEFCAYETCMIEAPIARNGFRSAGGHIHIGSSIEGSKPLREKFYQEDQINLLDFGRISVIRMMDLFVGLPSVILDKDPTTKDRRKLYGKPGSHRNKSYGVEYRSIGNFWLSSPKLVDLFFSLTLNAVKAVTDGYYQKLWETDEQANYSVNSVYNCIEDSDVEAAKKLLKELVPSECERILSYSNFEYQDFYSEWKI